MSSRYTSGRKDEITGERSTPAVTNHITTTVKSFVDPYLSPSPPFPSLVGLRNSGEGREAKERGEMGGA